MLIKEKGEDGFCKRQKCPECKKYSMEQMDNFKNECVADRWRCKYCLKDFAMREPVSVKYQGI